jgi:Zn-dependent protease/predicted transcriptional regulator
MKGSVRIATVAGIKIFIHWTFLILLAYIIYSNYRRGYDAGQIGWSVLFVLSVFGTVCLHELGHALMARRFKIKTRDITLLPIGGLARLESLPEKPSEELLVAIAGPAVNIVLALLSGLFADFPQSDQFNEVMASGVNGSNFLLNFCIVNGWLALFNLIPAFPMDGGRVLRAFLAMRMPRHVATRIAARIGQLLAIGFVFAGFFVNPFLMFIGIFIFLGAQAEAEQTQAQSLLRGYRVRDVLMSEVPSLQASERIEVAVKQLLSTQDKNFLVRKGVEPVGTLSREQIIKALSETGAGEIIENVMSRELVILHPEQSLDEAYRHVQQRADLMVVKEGNAVIGVLDTDNILEFIMVKSALLRDNESTGLPRAA